MQSFFNWVNRDYSAAPLALFRITFGVLVFISILRFQCNGWIDKLYIEPKFFFSYYGFSWVKPFGQWTYLLFAFCGFSALCVAIGYKYRYSSWALFLSFSYIELMDKTNYLNHYYFISVLSFLMIFLPMDRYFSWDAFRKKGNHIDRVPAWSIYSLRLMMAIVYFCAGLAKLNADWLFKAMPLKIWLPSKYDIPFLGEWLQFSWVHYFFSWSGALYDLAIPFLLLHKRTRNLAFLLVVIFHILTRILFPIGMFPYIMIVSALIFLDPKLHEKVLGYFAKFVSSFHPQSSIKERLELSFNKSKFWLLCVFFTFQVLFPFRYLLYGPSTDLFWTENGFRYSWRVMLMEKAGYAEFTIVDSDRGTKQVVNNSKYLTPIQSKQMSTQADFIVEYAHFLNKMHQEKGVLNPEIYVESYVALNGRRSQVYVKPNLDLSKVEDSWKGLYIVEPYKR